MTSRAIVVDERDSVATALADLAEGEVLALRVGGEDCRIQLCAPIAFGHKVALMTIPAGAPVRQALEEVGAEILPSRGLDFLDPWGNYIQVVEYRDIQYTKAPAVLDAMALGHLGKSEAALKELTDKGVRTDDLRSA